MPDDLRIPTADEREALYVRNLAVFQEHFPPGYELLRSIAETHSQIVFNENGEPDIEFQGTRLYGEGAYTYGRKGCEKERAAPSQMVLVPPQTRSLDNVSADFLFRVMKRAKDAGVEFNLAPKPPKCFHLICFGLGLGTHLAELIELTDCNSLIIVEPNLEFIKHACYFVDWEPIVRRFKAKGRSFGFITQSDHVKIAWEVRNQVRSYNICAFDGIHLFRLYPSSIMDRAQNRVRDEGGLFLTGLGFATDEIQMISNSFRNLRGYEGLIYRRAPKVRELPVFVVGSGPSIDGSLEILKANQDRAVIISLGTALTVLTQNGIKPDFHVELENVPAAYDVLFKFSKVANIRDVVLIATTTVDPRVKTLFDRTVFFFRKGISSYPIFSLGEQHNINECGPMVCNLGLSFAQEMGFREFYFFGVDLGGRSAEVHHSRFAPYHDTEESKYMDGEMAVWEGNFNTWVPANFGGKVISGAIHLWAKDAIERNMTFFRVGRRYYNCSDGVRILGAVPKKPSTVSLPKGADKKAVVDRLLGDFPRYTADDLRRTWTDKDWRKIFSDYGAELKGLIKRDEDEFDGQYLAKLTQTIVLHIAPAAEILFYRGSLLMTLTTIYYYSKRVWDVEQRRRFDDVCYEELVATIDMLQKMAVELVDALDAEA